MDRWDYPGKSTATYPGHEGRGPSETGPIREPLCDICDICDGMLRYVWDAVSIQGRYLPTIHPSFPAEASLLLNR